MLLVMSTVFTRPTDRVCLFSTSLQDQGRGPCPVNSLLQGQLIVCVLSRHHFRIKGMGLVLSTACCKANSSYVSIFIV